MNHSISRWQRMFTSLLLLGLFSAVSSLSAQRASVKMFDETSGLTNLNVHGFVEDSKGRVWIGTENGIFLANGNTFQKQVQFQNAGIEAVRVLRGDAADRIWALDSRQLYVYTGGPVQVVVGLDLRLVSTSREDLVSLPNDQSGIYLLRDGILERIYTEDHGTHWQVHGAFDQAFVAKYPVLRRLSNVVPAGPSSFWASAGHSLLKIDVVRHTVTQVVTDPGAFKGEWTALHAAKTGVLWVRTNNEVAFVDAKQALHVVARFRDRTLQVKDPQWTEDKEGNILLNLVQGIGLISRNHLASWTAKRGLPSQEIGPLIGLSSGEVWMSPSGHGVAKWLGYGQWEAWTQGEGLKSSVIWPMASDDRRVLWVAGDSAVDRIDLQRGYVKPLTTQLPSRFASALIVDKSQHVWIGYADGRLFELDSSTGKARLALSKAGRILKLLQDDEGTIWICSESGLYRFSAAEKWRHPRQVGTDEIPAGCAWYITVGKDRSLWLSSGTILYHLEHGRWKPIKLPFLPEKRHNFMLAVANDGSLWIQGSAPNALIHAKVENDQATVIAATRPYPGSSNITFVEIDKGGLLWVGSDAGVCVFNGSRWINLTTKDGLIWNDTDFHAFFQDSDGSVWIGTSAGLAHVLHPQALFRSTVPTVQFGEATLSKNILTGGAEQFYDLSRPTLEVSMLDLNYERNGRIQYRYHLEGLEDGWQTSQGNIRYPLLPSGAFKLSVVAFDEEQDQASLPVTLSFEVLAPWWKRPWFVTLEGLAASGFLVLCWRASMRMLVRRKEQLEQMVEQRTRELVQEKNELSAARRELIQAVRTDTLTGLLTRPAVFEEFSRLRELSLAIGSPFAYAMADLDSFKKINDNYGHVTGDEVLRTCAARVLKVLQPGELAGRYGGEELLILLPNVSPVMAVQRLEEIRAAIAAEPIVHGLASLLVTCSFGLAFCTPASQSVEALVHCADTALYRAKQNGRNRVECSLELEHARA